MSQPLLRFAPSPNGRLHLGHALSALTCWEAARRLGGTVLLRIEDIDRARCKPEFVAGIFEDLHWLGLTWPEPVLHQAQRLDAYGAAAARLAAMGLVYPCFCSRGDSAAAARGTDPDGAPLYPGTCRHLDPGLRAEKLARGEKAQYRLDVAAAAALAGVVTYTVLMPSIADRPHIRYARPERWGDVVLQRKDVPTSYHLSVVVDDAAQGITHVTRGRDLEAITDMHALLQLLLGLASPIYHFHPLVPGPDGQKLAKSKGAQSLMELRALGWTPADVRRAVGFGGA